MQPFPSAAHLARRWRQALLQELHRQLVRHAIQGHVVHHALNQLGAVGSELAPARVLALVTCRQAGSGSRVAGRLWFAGRAGQRWYQSIPLRNSQPIQLRPHSPHPSRAWVTPICCK